MAHSKLYVRLMNSPEWRALRWQVLAEHPLCERCESQGFVTASRCVHHLIPVESGRTEAECRDLAFRRNNLQALCYQCHSNIHKAERSYTPEVIKERGEERLSVWADNLKRKYGNTNGLKIWVTYHDDRLLKEYDLHDDDSHQLFAVHKSAPLDNINYMNPVWSEMVTMWYVWHNRIYSSRVGFGHYRRSITPSRLPDKGECAVYHIMKTLQGETIRDQYAKSHNMADIELMIGLIDGRYGKGNPYTRHIMEGREMVANCCFVLCWQDFISLGDFIFPLLDDFGVATGCGKDIDKWRAKAARDFPDADADTIAYQMRLPGFLAERLISAYITTHFNYYK